MKLVVQVDMFQSTTKNLEQKLKSWVGMLSSRLNNYKASCEITVRSNEKSCYLLIPILLALSDMLPIGTAINQTNDIGQIQPVSMGPTMI